MPDIPSWLSYDCIVHIIELDYPGCIFTKTAAASDSHDNPFSDFQLKIPAPNYTFNIRVYFPDRVVQRDRVIRICNLLDLSMEQLDQDCGHNKVSVK